MTITIEATYENGVLKPKEPVTFPEGTQLRVTMAPIGEDYDPLEEVIGIGDGPPEGDGAENHDKYIYGKLHP